MAKTRTGSFDIGFRLIGAPWQKELPAVIEWAKANDFAALDLRRDGDQTAHQVKAAGLRVGSVDLLEWQGMIHPDKAKRAEAVAKNAAYIKAAGAVNHFIVMLPAEAQRPIAENFLFMVDSFNALAPVFEEAGARLVVEGWPGPGSVVCNPEGYRAFFKECPSPAYGVNYDPSHLVRMGVDPLRFLREFGHKVFHVHGKDTELNSEALYEYGNSLPRIFGRNPAYGGTCWRYTLPGHGVVRWTETFKVLAEFGYQGCVCIELEDANFNVGEAGEKQGFILSRQYLAGC